MDADVVAARTVRTFHSGHELDMTKLASLQSLGALLCMLPAGIGGRPETAITAGAAAECYSKEQLYAAQCWEK
jgi:hypothetical protein